MRISLILLFFAANLLVRAQETGDWKEGVIVLSNNQVLNGSLFFTGFETVLFKTHDKELVSVFRAHDLQQIRFFDSLINVNRRFIIANGTEDHYQHSKLFEVVLDGGISVIRRLPLASESMMQQTHALAYDYFIKVDLDIVPLSKFRDRYYPSLLKNCFGLSAFVSAQKLNPNIQVDAIRIIKFCNTQNASVTFTTLH